MKVNPNKCNLLLSINQNKLANINSNAIQSSTSEKLIGVTIDINLKLHNLCKKVSQKANYNYALTRIASLMDADKRRSVMKAFISSHVNYCPLLWMFHDKGLNNKINRKH